MKSITTFTSKLIIFVILASGVTTNAYSQLDISKFVNESTQEANMVVEEYAAPFFAAIGNNFTNGWYSTAEPLKLLRFEVKIPITASFVPQDDRTFDLTALNLNHIRPSTGAPNEFPTILGKEDESALFEVYVSDPNLPGAFVLTDELLLPTTGTPIFPGISPQVSIGLIKKTELMIRFLPEMKLPNASGDDFKTKYFGLGIKHDVKQWIPIVNKLPIDISAIFGFTNATLSYTGEILVPSDLSGLFSDNTGVNYAEQNMTFDVKSWMAALIVSKKLPVFTFFGGFKYASATTDLGLNGQYPFININPTTLNEYVDHVENPINIESKHNQFGINGGLRVKMGVFNISLSGIYSPGGYSSATLGLGIGYFN